MSFFYFSCLFAFHSLDQVSSCPNRPSLNVRARRDPNPFSSSVCHVTMSRNAAASARDVRRSSRFRRHLTINGLPLASRKTCLFPRVTAVQKAHLSIIPTESLQIARAVVIHAVVKSSSKRSCPCWSSRSPSRSPCRRTVAGNDQTRLESCEY